MRRTCRCLPSPRAAPTGAGWKPGSGAPASRRSASWSTALIMRSSPASPRAAASRWCPSRWFARCAPSARCGSTACRTRSRPPRRNSYGGRATALPPWMRLRASFLQRLPNPQRRRRHLETLHARAAQRVHHGVHQRRQRAGDAGLAHALRAERVEPGRNRVLYDPGVGYQPGARHRIIHEAAGKELAALAVVHRELAEHLARSLGKPALYLPFDDLVVDDVAGVVADHVRGDFGFSGLRVDLHLGDMAAIGKSGAELVGVGDVELAPTATRQVLDRNRAVGPLDAIPALHEFDVG